MGDFLITTPPERTTFRDLDSIRARFARPELEHAFRQHHLRKDKLQALIAILILSVPNIIFVLSDLEFFRISRQFYELVAGRTIFVLLSVACLFRISRIRNEKALDRLVLLWTLLLSAFALYVGSTRPPEYLFDIVTEILVLMAIYACLPNRLTFQCIPAVVLTVGTLVRVLAVKTIPSPSGRALGVALLFTHLIGLWMSWRSHAAARNQFSLLLRERALYEELIQTTANLKTLKGLLPICSFCSKIRDEGGDWLPIDRYIESHASVEFTHSLCRDCIQVHYSDYLS